MKVVLESSSLFFKNYTGIPFYIHSLYSEMNALQDIDPVLGFRLKKKFSRYTGLQKRLLENPHVWHWQNLTFPRVPFDVSHSLHTPFLGTGGSLKIATVHDLAVHLPELRKYEFTSDYFKKKRWALFKEFAKKADAIITVSETTKRDFLKFFPFPEERVHAIPLAPTFRSMERYDGPSDILKKLNLSPKTYFISMGGVSLRKNTLNLVKGYHLSKSRSDHKLVIAGKVEKNQHTVLLEYILAHKLENRVMITEYLPDEDLRALYANAMAFLFPTFYEGFGIPILEAMAAKLPVLASTTGAAPETAGGHAILVDPHTPEHIGEGIDKLRDIDDDGLQNAQDYAKGFSWERTARSTTSVYRKYA